MDQAITLAGLAILIAIATAFFVAIVTGAFNND